MGPGNYSWVIAVSDPRTGRSYGECTERGQLRIFDTEGAARSHIHMLRTRHSGFAMKPKKILYTRSSHVRVRHHPLTKGSYRDDERNPTND